jgi:hypothetical protein
LVILVAITIVGAATVTGIFEIWRLINLRTMLTVAFAIPVWLLARRFWVGFADGWRTSNNGRRSSGKLDRTDVDSWAPLLDVERVSSEFARHLGDGTT